jgi:hypothetical protein
VLVGSNSEFVAAAQTAALEHIPAVGRGHALSKTVHTDTAANLGLIGSLGHSKYFLV